MNKDTLFVVTESFLDQLDNFHGTPDTDVQQHSGWELLS